MMGRRVKEVGSMEGVCVARRTGVATGDIGWTGDGADGVSGFDGGVDGLVLPNKFKSH